MFGEAHHVAPGCVLPPMIPVSSWKTVAHQKKKSLQIATDSSCFNGWLMRWQQTTVVCPSAARWSIKMEALKWKKQKQNHFYWLSIVSLHWIITVNHVWTAMMSEIYTTVLQNALSPSGVFWKLFLGGWKRQSGVLNYSSGRVLFWNLDVVYWGLDLSSDLCVCFVHSKTNWGCAFCAAESGALTHWPRGVDAKRGSGEWQGELMSYGLGAREVVGGSDSNLLMWGRHSNRYHQCSRGFII